MVLFPRFVPRVSLGVRRLTLFAPATTRACLLPVVRRVSSRRGIHVIFSQAQASFAQSSAEKASIDELPSSEVPPLEADIYSDWRHPLLGFTADEASQFIYIYLPRIATEDDVRALLARAGLHTAKFFMHYHLETARPQGRCYLKVADKNNVDAAIAALSRFTLLGWSLRPQKYGLGKASPAGLHLLYAGWLPSSTSHLTSRIVRPPMTSPPNLLAPLMNEQWIVFKHLEILNPDLKSNVAEAQEAAQFDVTRNFYVSFHQYDVVGITAPYKHKGVQGWCCKILFGNRKDAREAANLWRKAYEKKRQGMANVFRGGPDIHKKLWEYRQSLPEDTPKEEVDVLLELKYRELRFVTSDAERLHRLNYPTPESAVGLKRMQSYQNDRGVDLLTKDPTKQRLSSK